MNRNPILPTLLAGSILLVLSSCAEAPVKVGDNQIEKPLEQVTGITTDDIQKAGQKTELNLWDVYAMAVEHTEDLASKMEDIDQAEAEGQQGIASILPQIFLNDQKNWQSNGYVHGSPSTLLSPLGNAFYLTGTETIFTGLTQVAAIQGASALKDQNQYLLKQEARELLLSVARAYYSVLQLQDTLQSKQDISELNEQILKQEEQWRSMGRSRESDVLTTEAQLAQLKGDMASAQGDLNKAKDALVVLADWKVSQPLKSEEEALPTAYTFEQATAKVDNRFDVLAAKASVDVAEANLLDAHGEHLPSLAFQGDYYLEQDGGSPTPDWDVKLVASLPLFEGGAILAQERIAASKKRQAEMQYSMVHRQALQDIRGAYKAYATSLVAADAYAKALDAAQKNYDAVEHDRKLALNTNLDVLQALTLLQTAKSNFNQAHYQTLIDWIWLGAATGDLPKTVK